jgi:hypothetical protein
MRLAPCFLAIALCLAPRLAAAQTSEPPAGETVRLHVDAARFTKVLGRPSGDVEWTQVCSAPCDAPVPLDWQYKMTARGMKTSKAFHLDATAGQDAEVHLHPAYTAWFVGGLVSMSAGAVVAFVGFPTLLLARLGCGWVANHCSDVNDSELRGVAVVSASLLALGAIATLTNVSTTTSQDEASEAPAIGEPAWRTREQRPRVAQPATFGAPLLTLPF